MEEPVPDPRLRAFGENHPCPRGQAEFIKNLYKEIQKNFVDMQKRNAEMMRDFEKYRRSVTSEIAPATLA